MSYEIELKAHVKEYDVEAIKNKLLQLGVLKYSYTKSDEYWFAAKEKMDLPASGVRVRKEIRQYENSCTSQVIITYKTRERRGDIDVNLENEFEVTDAIPFERLLTRCGLQKKGVNKIKKGRYFVVDGINSELTFVEKLGWFLELEIIACDDALNTTNEATKRIYDLFTKVGITKNQYEPRYYTEMLAGLPR
jgi:adenylate cyclase class 2